MQSRPENSNAHLSVSGGEHGLAQAAEPKFTPGPWRVKDYDDFEQCWPIQQNGFGFLWTARTIGGLKDGEERANADLLAAAPAMYDALQGLHDDIDEYARINNLGGFDNHWMKAARAALAAARGESQEADK